MKPRSRLCLLTTLVLFSLQPVANADMLVSGFASDAVYRFDSSGGYLGVFASHPTLMDGPTAIVYNSAGNLLVMNSFTLNVLKFDGASGAFLGTHISSAALGGVGLTDPDDMEVGPDGNLYMMSHHDDAANIFKFDGLTGAYLGVFAAASPPISHQHGLAFGPGGHLYQGNVDTGLVEKFNGVTGVSMGPLTGAPVASIGDLVFGSSRLYVASGGGGGVAKFDAITGASLGYLIAPGSTHWGMTIDGGILYVSDLATGKIQKYDTTTPTDTFLGDFIATGPSAFDLLAMPVPEPGCATLLIVGLASLAIARKQVIHRSI